MKTRLLVSIAFVFSLFSLYAVFIHEDGTITQAQASYAALIVMFGALPGVVILADRREADLLPLMPLHGLFYAITYGLPIFSGKMDWSRVNSAVITDTLTLTVLGLICLYLGYYVSRGLYSRSPRPIRFLSGVPLERQIGIAWTLYAMSMLLQLVPTLGSLPSVGQLTAPLGYLSMGILFLLALDNAVSKKHLILLTAAIGFSLTIKLLSGSLAQAVFLLIFLGIIYWGKRRSIPLGFVLFIGGVIAILPNPAKHHYREYTWTSADSASQSYVYKARMFWKATYDYYANDDVSSDGIDADVVKRIGHSVSVFADVISMTPEQVPYWLGGSYQTLWTSFIPRFLWPDKPKATIGNEFGHRYNFLSSTDSSTSHNLPWLPEFYANFGIFGVVGGMFAVGFLFRFLVQKLSVPTGCNIEYVLGATLTFSLFYAESNFALMVGGVLTTYLALLILLRLLTLSSAPSVIGHKWRARRHFSK